MRDASAPGCNRKRTTDFKAHRRGSAYYAMERRLGFGTRCFASPDGNRHKPNARAYFFISLRPYGETWNVNMRRKSPIAGLLVGK